MCHCGLPRSLFLDRTVNTIFAFEGGGFLRQYPGNYSVYLEQQKNRTESPKTVVKSAPAISSSSPPTGAKLSFKEKREYEQLEGKIGQWENEKLQLESQLYESPDSDFATLQTLSTRLGELTQAIEEATERWLALAERVGS